MRTTSRILVVESDPNQVRMVGALVGDASVELVVAESIDAAEQMISSDQPALVLSSTIAPPEVEARLMAAVRALPSSVPVPVLTLPPLRETPAASEPERGPFCSFFSRRRAQEPWPHYDADALGERIREALAQAVQEREWRASREQLWQDAAANQVEPQFLRRAEPRPRAPRIPGSDVAWLSTVKLSWGMQVQLVNISQTGMLIESGTRFTEGAHEEFELAGAARRVLMPSRLIRSNVTRVEETGVRYRTAVVFDAEMQLWASAIGTHSASKPRLNAPPVLEDVIAWVREEAAKGTAPSRVRAAYELELQHLVKACDVRICAAPSVGDDNGHAVFFSVPGTHGGAMLRATFDPARRPGRKALELLKQAALIAPTVVELETAAPS